MNIRTPLWPLIRNELGIGHCPGITLVLVMGFYLASWLVFCLSPTLQLFISCDGNLAAFFSAFGDPAGFVLCFWLVMAGWLFALALLPGILNPIQSVRIFEFMFTRAIDRRKLFRARAAVVYAVMLGPLLLNLPIASVQSDTIFSPEPGNIGTEQYMKAFPQSHAPAGKSSNQPASLVVPRGAIVLIASFLWLGTLSLVLMQGYCALIANRVKQSPWLAALAIGGPILALFILAPWIPRLHPNYCEEGFLFFVRNKAPLAIGLLVLVPAVQTFSERRFSELEIL